MLPPNQKIYACTFIFSDDENIIHLRFIPFDTKVVETRVQVQHPLTGEMKVVGFAGASTRRQGLYKFRELTKNGQILGG